VLGDLDGAVQLRDPHMGRIRQFPHVEGEFASLVYMPVRVSPSLSKQLDALVDALRPLSPSPVQRVPSAEIHISLSRAFTLHRSQLVPFTDALRKALKVRRAPRLRVASVELLSNETRTSFFGTLVVQPCTREDEAEMSGLLGGVDAVLAAFGKPPFYSPPVLHFSVAWSLSPFVGFRQAAMPACLHEMHANCVLCKLGSRVEEFTLR
jgi:hypothetical protein